MKILVIDDDEQIGRSLIRALKNHDVRPEVDPLVAIDRAMSSERQDEPFDVILCDLALRDLDGLAVFERLRALMTTRPLFVLMSGHRLDVIPPDDMLPDLILTKPFSTAELEAKLADAARLVAARAP